MLTLQFVPSDEIIGLNSEKKLQKLLRIIRQDKIVLMEGKLTSKEEADLIEMTMEQVDRNFKGIEIASLEPENNGKFVDLVKDNIFKLFFGGARGMTVLGPANIIKEIKRDPNKLQLYTSANRGKK